MCSHTKEYSCNVGLLPVKFISCLSILHIETNIPLVSKSKYRHNFMLEQIPQGQPCSSKQCCACLYRAKLEGMHLSQVVVNTSNEFLQGKFTITFVTDSFSLVSLFSVTEK